MAPFVPSIERQIACIKRELRLRNQNYPQWVAKKRMTQKMADEEILCMEAILETLQKLAQAGKPVQEGLPFDV